jgi:hypothetical protein
LRHGGAITTSADIPVERMGFMQTETHTDNELLAMAADDGLWLVRGGNPPVLATAKNLQSALIMAFEQSTANQTVVGIVKMPNDVVQVPPRQIYRLWQHYRINDKFGNQVGGGARP